MILPNTYTLDKETIKLNAYRLLCIFYANKEIARFSDPENRSDPPSRLQEKFFSSEMTQLLLTIAIGLRVIDDQMEILPITDPIRKKYLCRRDKVNQRYKCVLLNMEMPLREVCNKVIHATTVEPHITPGAEAHAFDVLYWLGLEDEEASSVPRPMNSVEWEHLTC